MNGAVWQYRRPGFEALLLAELQRQQRSNQYCDTVLHAEGVSVPVHSCVISALSPQLSCALSSNPPPQTGGAHLLEFKSLRAGTLLQMVALLYSGEMIVEESEKQEAVSAAAKLGIHGLVEVLQGTGKDGKNGGGEPKDAGVQTESPPCPDWRSVGQERDMRNTGDLERGSAHPLGQSTFPLQSIDSASLVAPGSAPNNFYVPDPWNIAWPLPATDPQGWWEDLPGAVSRAEAASEGEAFDRFEGNIPGFISHFLNLGKEKSLRGGRGRRGRGRGEGRAGRAGTGERKVRKPRAKASGRGMAKTQAVGAGGKEVHRAQKDWMGWRWGAQGGGAVGRTLYLKTLSQTQPIKIHLKRRGKGNSWKVNRMDAEILCKEAGRAKKRSRKRKGVQEEQPSQESFTESPSARSDLVAPSSTPHSNGHMCDSVSNLHGQGLCVRPSPSPAPVAVQPPAPDLFHTTTLPQVSAVQDDQSELCDRLLEQLIMDLDFLPNNNAIANTTPEGHPLPPAPSASRPGCSPPSPAATVATQGPHCVATPPCQSVDGSGPAESETPALFQPQEEGELHDILDHFLRAFELQIHNCEARRGTDAGGRNGTQASSPAAATDRGRGPHADATLGECSKAHIQTGPPKAPSVALSLPLEPTPQPVVSLPRLTSGNVGLPRKPPDTPVATDQPNSRHSAANGTKGNRRVLTQRLRRERQAPSAQPALARSPSTQGKLFAKSPPVLKRGRGRPRKISLPSVTSSTPAINVIPKVHSNATRAGKNQVIQRLRSTWKQVKVKMTGDCEGNVREKLRLVPLVSLERRCPLLQAQLDSFRCQSMDIKNPSTSKRQLPTTPSGKIPVKNSQNTSSSFPTPMMTYPIRSRIKQLSNMQGMCHIDEAENIPNGTDTMSSSERCGESDSSMATTRKMEAEKGRDKDVRTQIRIEGQNHEPCRTLPELKSQRSPRRGGKRRIRRKEVMTKRVCFDQVGLTTPALCAPLSEVPRLSEGKEVIVTMETEDVVYMDSLQGHGEYCGPSQGPTSKGEEDVLQEEAQDGGKHEMRSRGAVMTDQSEPEMNSCEEELNGDTSEGGFAAAATHDISRDVSRKECCLPLNRNSPEEEGKAAPSTDSVKALLDPAPPSHTPSGVNLGSTGSREQEEDTDEVDIVGGCSPIPDYSPLSLTELQTSEDQEEEDVDVIG